MIVGASPSDGSSMIRSVGFVEQRPPDREHLLLAARELRAAVALALGEPREEVVDRRRRSSAAVASRGARIIRRCSSTRERREQAPPLRDVADPRARAILLSGLPRSSSPCEADRARRRAAGDKPMIALQSVVLPMPLRPTIATDSLPISNDDVLERLGASRRTRSGPRPRAAVRLSASGLVARAEIEVVDELVRADLRRRAFDDHAAVVHHRHVLRDAERDVHVVLDQDQRDRAVELRAAGR